MKLYYAKGACSLAVRILLHELALDCEYELVDTATKKTATGIDFYTINPKGSVPTFMLDNKTMLTENAVIQQYIADTHHAYQLLPAVGDFKRYKVLEWLNFISSDLHKGCTPLFHPDVPVELKKNIFIPLLEKRLSYADEQLTNKEFLLGDQYTLPDGYLFVILSWAGRLRLELSKFKQLTRYFEALKTRESIKTALAEEDLYV